jgi:adenylate cyclase
VVDERRSAKKENGSDALSLCKSTLRPGKVRPDGPTIAETLVIDETARVDFAAPADEVQRLSLLCELPFDFSEPQSLDAVLKRALKHLVAVIPVAQRGAILIEDPSSGRLLLKAYLPEGAPSVSMTMANHAFCRGEGISWCHSTNPSESQRESRIAAGLYAPLVYNGKALGIICVDSSDSGAVFDGDDLKFLVSAARHIALAISHRFLQDDLRRSAALTERLLTSFSPKIRHVLSERARQGRLRLGGQRSEVTILISDIRGFTQMSSNMDASDLTDMLNAYLSSLVEAIFRFDGTIDKFAGDAILAVFGSPEVDPNQHLNAVRASLAMQDAMKTVNAARLAKGQVVCEIGIGIHCGEVVHGFIGSDERMDFTVIGEAVNRASRYCDGAGGGEILISEEVFQRVWRDVHATSTSLTTKHEGQWPAYRLLSNRAH